MSLAYHSKVLFRSDRSIVPAPLQGHKKHLSQRLCNLNFKVGKAIGGEGERWEKSNSEQLETPLRRMF